MNQEANFNFLPVVPERFFQIDPDLKFLSVIPLGTSVQFDQKPADELVVQPHAVCRGHGGFYFLAESAPPLYISYTRDLRPSVARRVLHVNPGTFFYSNPQGEIELKNETDKPAQLTWWPHQSLISTECTLSQVMKKNYGFTRTKDILLALRAEQGLPFDFELSRLDHSLFEDSLSSRIRLATVVAKDRASSLKSSATPLNVLEIREGEEEYFAARHSNSFVIFLPSDGYIFDLEEFIYECHSLAAWLESEGRSSFKYEESPERLKHCTSVSGGFSAQNLKMRREATEDLLEGLTALFPVNMYKNNVPLRFESCNHLVSVCAGTQPAFLYENIAPQIPKITLVDQNLRAVEMWKLFLKARTSENLKEVFGAFAKFSAHKPEELSQLVEENYGRSLSAFAQTCEEMDNKTTVEWLNFIMDEYALSRLLNAESRPLIWISNAFESRVNRIIFGDQKLKQKFATLTGTIAEKIQARFEPALDTPFSGRFLSAQGEVVGYIIDDHRDLKWN